MFIFCRYLFIKRMAARKQHGCMIGNNKHKIFSKSSMTEFSTLVVMMKVLSHSTWPLKEPVQSCSRNCSIRLYLKLGTVFFCLDIVKVEFFFGPGNECVKEVQKRFAFVYRNTTTFAPFRIRLNCSRFII